MSYCCFSARCRPPDSDGRGTPSGNKLEAHRANSDTGGEIISNREKEGSVYCLQLSKSTKDKNAPMHRRWRLSSWRNVSMLTERDRQAIKTQLSIWFPCMFNWPRCEAVMEVKSNVAQKLSSMALVQRNEGLSESKRQRKFHRKICRDQEYDSMPIEFSLRLSQSGIRHSETQGNLMPPMNMAPDDKQASNLGSGNTHLGDNRTMVVDMGERSDLFKRSNHGMNGMLIPEWFISFIEEMPVLEIDLLNIDQHALKHHLSFSRRIELILISTTEARKKNSPVYVSVKEMISECSEASEPVARSTDCRVVNVSNNEPINAGAQPWKSASDLSLSGHSNRSKGSFLDNLSSEQRKVCLKHNSTPYIKPSRKSLRRSQGKRIAESHPCNRPHTLKDAWMKSSGDFISGEISSERSKSSETQTIMTTMRRTPKRHGSIADGIGMPNGTMAADKKWNLRKDLDIDYSLLNICNSASNGVNRTHWYSRDYFSGNPKTKVSQVKRSTSKDSGKDEVRVSREKPLNKSPRKVSHVSPSGSPESRRSIFSSYEAKYRGQDESSEDDSRSGNTMVELSIYKPRKIATRSNPHHCLQHETFANEDKLQTPHRNIQGQTQGRQCHIEKPQTIQVKCVQGAIQAPVRTETRVEASKSISKPYSQPIPSSVSRSDEDRGSRLDPSSRGNVKIEQSHDRTEVELKTSVAQSKYIGSKHEIQISQKALNANHPNTSQVVVTDPLNQGDVVRESDTVVDTDKNIIRLSQQSPATAQRHTVKDSNFESEKSALQSTKMTAAMGQELNAHVVTVSPAMLVKEGGDGPDKSMPTRDITSNNFPKLSPGDLTSNAGGDEDEESAEVSPQASAAALVKPEVPQPEANVVEQEQNKRVSVVENVDQGIEKEEQKKESPCPEVLAECMRKWGRPTRCKYSYTPNLDPPCCKSQCVYPFPTANQESGGDETKAGEEVKEESKTMKCNFTGFDDAKKSELEALIDKHVAYLRCTQGENAAIPKQTSFISNAPDPYSQMCKDLAIKISAGVFNQSMNKDKYPCPDVYGQLKENCKDPCLKLPPLGKTSLCCPEPCPPTSYRDSCLKLPKLCSTPPPCGDPCFPAPCCTKLPNISRTPSYCIDPCSTFPKTNPCCPDPYSKPCSPPPCCTDPCAKLFQKSSPPPYCADPCNPSRPCVDPCIGMRKSCAPSSCLRDPCTGLSKLCSVPSRCIDPSTGLTKPVSPRPGCIDPCTGLPKSCGSRPDYTDQCSGFPAYCSSRVVCTDPCTGIPKPCSPRPVCIDSCTGLPKPCSPRPICIDPCTGLPKYCSPRPICIDPLTGLPKSCSSRPCYIDPCTGLSKPCSPPPSCIDPCTGLPKPPIPRSRCINPSTGFSKACLDPCSSIPMRNTACPSFPKQYRLDPITHLPILCSQPYCVDPCFDACDKISSISCNSASDTKLSKFSSALSFFKEPQDSVAHYRPRPCPPPCSRPCSGSFSFLEGKSGSFSRRRSSSLDHFKSLRQRRTESQNLAKKVHLMESNWSGIKQKACEVMNELVKLQQEQCCPKPQPCLSPCADLCASSTCDPCISPICNPCPSPINNPCTSPIYKSSTSPVCSPYESPVSNPCNRMIVNDLESDNFTKIDYPCLPTTVCHPKPRIKTITVCCECDKQTNMSCRSACNQTSEFGRKPRGRCSTSCAQLNESSNKKSQAGSGNNFAEISTAVGPSLMAPPPSRKRNRSEKKCTIMRIGKSEERRQVRDPNTTTDISCCSTQAEGGKIAEIAKFVKECFDESAISSAVTRPVVKIRYNKGGKNCPNPCEDIRLKEHISKAIKKGKEVQKKNAEQNGKNSNGPLSRTVLRIKAGKDSQDSCEIYNVQLEDNNPTADLVKKDTPRSGKVKCNPEAKSNEDKKYLDVRSQQKMPSLEKNVSDEVKHSFCETDETKIKGSHSGFDQCHHEIVCPQDCENISPENFETDFQEIGSCTEQEINRHQQEKAKEQVKCCQEKKQKVYLRQTKCLKSDFDHCVETQNQCPQSGTHECNEPCQQGNLTQSNNKDKQSNEVDLEHLHHNNSHEIRNDNLSNTNENANSEQHDYEKGSKEFGRQIPGVPSRHGAYSYDLSKCVDGINPDQLDLNSYVCDVFLESSECSVDKLAPAWNNQKRSSAQLERPKVSNSSHRIGPNNIERLNNINCGFWSPESREIRKRCLYIDDPSWEAFEYIGAHVFSLPTSCPSQQDNLPHQNRLNFSGDTEKMKTIRKRHFFSRSCTASCGKQEKSSLTKRCISQLDQRKVPEYFDLRTKSECLKTISQAKAAKGLGVPMKAQGGTLQNSYFSQNETKPIFETKVGFTQGTALRNSQSSTFSSPCPLSFEEYKNHQQNSHTSVSTKRGLHKISEETGQYSDQSSILSKDKAIKISCSKESARFYSGYDRQLLRSRERTETRKSRVKALETSLSTEGSEGSTHGIEDLPLDIESQISQLRNLSSSKAFNIAAGSSERSTVFSTNQIVQAGDYVEVCSSAPSQNKMLVPNLNSEKSTVPSQNKIMQPGDYVEVCSSATFQNKILTPYYSKMWQNKQNQMQQDSKQVQKKFKKPKFRVAPLDEKWYFEIKHESIKREKVQSQSKVSDFGYDFSCDNLLLCHDYDDSKDLVKDGMTESSQETVTERKSTLSRDNQFGSATKPASNSWGLTSGYERSQKYPFSKRQSRGSSLEIGRQNCDRRGLKFTEQRVFRTPSRPILSAQCCVSNDKIIPKPVLLNHVCMGDQRIDFKSHLLATSSVPPISSKYLSKEEDATHSELPIEKYALGTQNMAGKDLASLKLHDMTDSGKSVRPSSCTQTTACDSPSGLPVHRLLKNHRGLGAVGGGDAWSTLRAGCAEVTQASENRVVLRGAYVQQQPKSMSTSSYKSLESAKMRVIPFELVFFKSAGVDKTKLNLKGIYSCADLDSPMGNVETWGFEI